MNQKDQQIDWPRVKRVLVVKLRSIGDTVLATPSLIALRRFLPDAEIDILLEDWVAPLLDGFDVVDRVVAFEPTGSGKLRAAREIRRRRYDLALNLHGGSTAGMFMLASRSPYRLGFAHYRYPIAHTHLFPPAAEFWHRAETHSAEQQLALLGHAGVPVDDRPRSRLAVTAEALASLTTKLAARPSSFDVNNAPFALIHPAAAFATKQWSAENFARVAEYLAARGIKRVAIAAPHESRVLEDLTLASRVPLLTADDLTLPEITALASRAKLFVGNDSGIAHIAAAVNTPSVVIFGSSNRTHWSPWTDAPNRIVFEPFPCQPCPGYECREFGSPRCILSITPESVTTAISQLIPDH